MSGGSVLEAIDAELIEPQRLAACVIDELKLNRRRPAERRTFLSAVEALAALDFEAQLVAVAAENLAQGLPFTDEDRARLLIAWARIQYIVREVIS